MLIVFTYLIVAILGLSIGSFINVLIYRLPIILGLETSQNDNLSIYKPRSFCPICNVKIPMYRNIPVFSFIFQKVDVQSVKKNFFDLSFYRNSNFSCIYSSFFD